jgi:hypothetical protein
VEVAVPIVAFFADVGVALYVLSGWTGEVVEIVRVGTAPLDFGAGEGAVLMAALPWNVQVGAPRI